MAAPEARIEQTDEGAEVVSPGWFIVNMADCPWTRDDKGGEWATYGEPDGEFQQYGIGIHVLHPGQVNGLYHSESVQEDFLVLSGECLLLVEEQERRLKAWDFIHFAPGTRHICIGAGPNSAKAGSAVPVKFSLGGDRGLAILADGYPASVQVDCVTGARIGSSEPTASDDGLTFANGQYSYAWKTSKSWGGTCRQLQVLLVDGTLHTALFKFK